MKQRTGWFPWLLRGALIAGTLDICYAISFAYLRRGMAPSRLLQFVASGALGPAAYEGGLPTALLGLGFHYLNALLITGVFFAGAALLPALLRRAVLSGVLYGIVVYAVMNLVVIPLSRIGPRPLPATDAMVTGLLIHLFGIGTPIALAARRGFHPR